MTPKKATIFVQGLLLLLGSFLVLIGAVKIGVVAILIAFYNLLNDL